MCAIKYDRPSLWFIKTINQIDQWGFPATVWSYETNSFPSFDLQIDSIDDVIISDGSGEIFDSKHEYSDR